MRQSYQLFAGIILFLLLSFAPMMAVNINISGQITKKDVVHELTILTDTIPVENPYGEIMEPLTRPRRRGNTPKGYSSYSNSYSSNYWENDLDSYYEDEEQKPLVIKEPLIEVYNENAQVKKIKDDYTGFKVEIANSPTALPESDLIFTQHGNIAEHKRADETFSYYLGDFDNEVDAYEFYNRILKERYPLARVAKFEEGRRVW